MSSFLKKMEQDQQKAQAEKVDQQMVAEEDSEEDEEESKDTFLAQSMQAQMKLGQGQQQQTASAVSQKKSGGMPMPDGLLPTGGILGERVQREGGSYVYAHVDGGQPPKQSAFSGSAGLKKLQQQYEPMAWNDFYDTQEFVGTTPVYVAGNEGHVFVCLHGAGHSAMSFAALAEKMKLSSTLVAFDFRGHGQNHCDDQTDLSQETLLSDTLKVLEFVTQKFEGRTLFLVGHSMGGSIATKVAHKIENEMQESELAKALSALVIIDVVEGTAMDALPFMEQIVKNRPHQFPDLQSVIKYGVTSGQVRDKRSARVSMPAQVVEETDKATGLKKYVWRTDLMASKPYWTEWFKGLTEAFLTVKMQKLLILAGSERMDKDLTIAQMQGKFAMIVIENVGHVVQEDAPAKTAEQILKFIEKYKFPFKYSEPIYITSVSGKKVRIGR